MARNIVIIIESVLLAACIVTGIIIFKERGDLLRTIGEIQGGIQTVVNDMGGAREDIDAGLDATDRAGKANQEATGGVISSENIAGNIEHGNTEIRGTLQEAINQNKQMGEILAGIIGESGEGEVSGAEVGD